MLMMACCGRAAYEQIINICFIYGSVDASLRIRRWLASFRSFKHTRIRKMLLMSARACLIRNVFNPVEKNGFTSFARLKLSEMVIYLTSSSCKKAIE